MTELELKYGCNPNQKPACIFMKGDAELPLTVLNGKPGYINFMDALNSWQLVKALKQATGLPAAASFKHVSPAGAALGLPLTEVERQIYFAPEGELSPIACAYIRARGADRLCSYGDWAALSDTCDADTARYLALEVSDGVIAPDYTAEALAILKAKRKGGYNVVKIDPSYTPAPVERRSIFGIVFEQGYNDLTIDEAMLENIVTANRDLPQAAKHDMLLSLITLKYTQSNSVCYVKDGMTIGVGAGQQSRIHCTRLAGNKADIWWLRQHPKVLGLQFVDGIRRPDRDNAIDIYISDEHDDVLADGVWQSTFKVRPEVLTDAEKKEWIAKQRGVTVGSDAFFPFGDNVERAFKSGVKYIAQPGGSIRDDHVIATADKHDIVMAFTGIRLFHH
ncbi:MAG: phosphoribosylaminoimidazolecarboxamide formyltransferase [Oscillospiraceae bacterium]|nr:phosphoribosylaminoimidazolecarboxamide formyltransferase [Oscillospiraceae bacterium]